MKIIHKKPIIFLLVVLILFSIHLYKNRSIETTYTSKYQNFTLTFPPDWNGKYKILEKENYLTVSLKAFGNVELFTITTDLNETLDTRAVTKINGKDYLVGGPTGCPYSDLSSSRTKKLYAKLKEEVPKVISSIK